MEKHWWIMTLIPRFEAIELGLLQLPQREEVDGLLARGAWVCNIGPTLN